jgi:hypothetical protein
MVRIIWNFGTIVVIFTALKVVLNNIKGSGNSKSGAFFIYKYFSYYCELKSRNLKQVQPMSLMLIGLMNETISISSKASARVAKLGKDHVIAYAFAKLLSSIVKHPIIFNYRANLTPLRLLIGLSDSSYRKQLNLALQLGYCVQEGKHLRLVSHKQERKIGKINSCAKYDTIKIKDIKQFIYISVLKYNANSQKQAISYKESPIAHIGSSKVVVNHNITLSCRKAAEILGFKSYSYANDLLHSLQDYGLTMIKNVVQISETDYNYFKSIKKPNASYNHLTEKYLFTNASQPKFKPFYQPKSVKTIAERLLSGKSWSGSELFGTYF